jgi:hypothetical protein
MDSLCDNAFDAFASYRAEIKKLIDKLTKNEISIEIFDESLAQIVASIQNTLRVVESEHRSDK